MTGTDTIRIERIHQSTERMRAYAVRGSDHFEEWMDTISSMAAEAGLRSRFEGGDYDTTGEPPAESVSVGLHAERDRDKVWPHSGTWVRFAVTRDWDGPEGVQQHIVPDPAAAIEVAGRMLNLEAAQQHVAVEAPEASRAESTVAQLVRLRDKAAAALQDPRSRHFDSLAEVDAYATGVLTAAARHFAAEAQVVVANRVNGMGLRGAGHGPSLVTYRPAQACKHGCPSSETPQGNVTGWFCNTCSMPNPSDMIAVTALHGGDDGWFAPRPGAFMAGVELGVAAADNRHRAVAVAGGWTLAAAVAHQLGGTAVADPSLRGDALLERWVQGAAVDGRANLRIEGSVRGTGPERPAGLCPWESFALWCPADQHLVIAHAGPDPANQPDRWAEITRIDAHAAEHTASGICMAETAEEQIRGQLRIDQGPRYPAAVLDALDVVAPVRCVLVEVEPHHIDHPMMPQPGKTLGLTAAAEWAAQEPSRHVSSLSI